MQLKVFKYLFFDELVEFQSNRLLQNIMSDKLYHTLIFIGLPKKVLGKFVADLNYSINSTKVQLLKSNISDIYIGIDIETENIICYSKYTTDNCFVNTDYELFIKCHFAYELYKQQILIPQKLGPYYDNTATGGNFEKYACLLEDIIKDIDERAAKEGVWHGLIDEKKLGVI